MLRLYNLLLSPLRVAAPAVAAWRSARGGSREAWDERLGRRLPSVPPGGIWIHGASVGEARIATSLAAGLREAEPSLPLAASAVTRTGRERLPAPPAVDAAFHAPLDFPGPVRRVLSALRPRALVLIETELWPNLLALASRAGASSCLVNGRLSPERMARYRRLRSLYRPLLAGLAGVGAQDGEAAERLRSLGARPEAIEITGNVKYDLPPPAEDRDLLRRRYALAANRPVVAAGSTGEGEDAPVLDAFHDLRREFPDAFLLLAPRHPTRFRSAEEEARRRGLRLHRFSDGEPSRAGGTDGILLDALGALSTLYALADVAFVGGSLVPVGGHNVLEPAAASVPVLFGPHTHHVGEPAEALLRRGGARRVADAAALARAWGEWLRSRDERERAGRAALAVVLENRGALARTVALVLRAAGRSGRRATS